MDAVHSVRNVHKTKRCTLSEKGTQNPTTRVHKTIDIFHIVKEGKRVREMGPYLTNWRASFVLTLADKAFHVSLFVCSHKREFMTARTARAMTGDVDGCGQVKERQ